MKPRVWKDPKNNLWATSYGPNNERLAYYLKWKNAFNWAIRYASRYTQEPTC